MAHQQTATADRGTLRVLLALSILVTTPLLFPGAAADDEVLPNPNRWVPGSGGLFDPGNTVPGFDERPTLIVPWGTMFPEQILQTGVLWWDNDINEWVCWYHYDIEVVTPLDPLDGKKSFVIESTPFEEDQLCLLQVKSLDSTVIGPVGPVPLSSSTSDTVYAHVEGRWSSYSDFVHHHYMDYSTAGTGSAPTTDDHDIVCSGDRMTTASCTTLDQGTGGGQDPWSGVYAWGTAEGFYSYQFGLYCPWWINFINPMAALACNIDEVMPVTHFGIRSNVKAYDTGAEHCITTFAWMSGDWPKRLETDCERARA